MELTSSAITAVFIGLVWTLIKVVEYFISRRGSEEKVDKENRKEGARVVEAAEVMSKLSELQAQGTLIAEMYDKVKKLEESHSVVDENLVPRWYVPSELLPLVREMHKSMEIMCRELEDNLSAVKDGQSSLIERILDLVSSQKIMVERLGDLIAKLNKRM
jgi:hypothetical protein